MPGLEERQKHHEKVLNHDVIGFTTAVAEKIGDDASRWFHFGLTSGDILIADVKTARAAIAKRAKEHKFTPRNGRNADRQPPGRVRRKMLAAARKGAGSILNISPVSLS